MKLSAQPDMLNACTSGILTIALMLGGSEEGESASNVALEKDEEEDFGF